jgi:hypothetical protein
MVTDPAPTPTEAMPAPEIFKRLENVPDELDVVFPNAVSDIEDVCTDADMVIVLAFWPMPIPAPAERDTLFDVPLRVKLPPAAVAPLIVMTWLLWLRVILLPPTSVIPPEVIFVVAPAVLPEEICNELMTVELFVA